MTESNQLFDRLFNLHSKGSLEIGTILELLGLSPQEVEERLEKMEGEWEAKQKTPDVGVQVYRKLLQDPDTSLEEAVAPFEGRERGWAEAAWRGCQFFVKRGILDKDVPEHLHQELQAYWDEIHYEHMDPEVVELCRRINSFPGIQTTESCCGHGKTPFRIWFKVDEGDHRGLFMLTRCADRRYWKYGHKWRLILSVGDAPHHPLPIHYLLESEDRGEEAYLQAEDLVRNIEFHQKHVNFLVGYDLEELAAPGVLDTE